MTRRRAVLAGAATAAMVSVAVCMAVLRQPGHPSFTTLPLAVASTVIVGFAVAVLIWHGRRHSRLTSALVRRSRAVELHGQLVYELDGLDAALVAGLRHPRIFCASDLRRRLAPDELRAVLLHERFHQLDHAPIKLVVLQALAPFLAFSGAGRAWVARSLAALEIAADSHALAHGASRSALASALLRLSNSPSGVGVGFTSAVDLRLTALVDGRVPDAVSRPMWPGLLSTIALVCGLVSLLL